LGVLIWLFSATVNCSSCGLYAALRDAPINCQLAGNAAVEWYGFTLNSGKTGWNGEPRTKRKRKEKKKDTKKKRNKGKRKLRKKIID